MKSIGKTIKGRGTARQIDSRFLSYQYEDIDDGWGSLDTEETKWKTHVQEETVRSIITHNQSPDLPFSQSINPYRGCEHGCSYCYARPTHAYLDLSPGLDFESRLFAKTNAAECLRKELDKKSYQCSAIALGANTDPYQPIERHFKITRQILEVLNEYQHPLVIVTKSALIERDIDVLSAMAEKNLLQVFISVTTLKNDLARKLEPRATAPHRRLQALQNLTQAGVPAGVLFAPVIPVLNDTEMESIIEQAAERGVLSAAYVMLRLPHEVRPVFKEWLQLHEPLKCEHVLSQVRDIRGGKENDSEFGRRMTGQGNYARIIAQRFKQICRKTAMNKTRVELETSLFRNSQQREQLSLF